MKDHSACQELIGLLLSSRAKRSKLLLSLPFTRIGISQLRSFLAVGKLHSIGLHVVAQDI